MSGKTINLVLKVSFNLEILKLVNFKQWFTT